MLLQEQGCCCRSREPAYPNQEGHGKTEEPPGKPDRAPFWAPGPIWAHGGPNTIKTTKIDTCLLGVVVFAGKKPPEATRGRNSILFC